MSRLRWIPAVPAVPIYSVADMMQAPHFQARSLREQVDIDGKPLQIPALMPRLHDTPGGYDLAWPRGGAHNQEIFGQWLGLSAPELQELQGQGIV